MRDAHKDAARHHPLPRSAVPQSNRRGGTDRSQERGWPAGFASAATLGLRQGPLQRGTRAGPPLPPPPRPGPPPRQGRRRSRLLQVRLSRPEGPAAFLGSSPGGPAQHAHRPRAGPPRAGTGRGGAGAVPAGACALPPSGVLDGRESEGEGSAPRFCGKSPPPTPEALRAGQLHVRSPEPGCRPSIACGQLPPERRGRGQEARFKVTRPEQVGLVGRCEGGAAGGL